MALLWSDAKEPRYNSPEKAAIPAFERGEEKLKLDAAPSYGIIQS